MKPSQETGIFLAVLLPLAARGPPAQVAFVMGPRGTLSQPLPPPPSLDPGMTPHLAVKKAPSWADRGKETVLGV